MASAVETDLSQSRPFVLAASARERRDRHARDGARDPRAGARRARLPARGQDRPALSRHARRPAFRARAEDRGEPVDAPIADDAMARWRAPRRLRGRAAGSARRDRCRPVRRVVAPVPALWRHPWRSASRQLYRRASARASATSMASICSTMAACASSRRGSCIGVVELYRALEANDKARTAQAYEMWGFSRLTPRHD